MSQALAILEAEVPKVQEAEDPKRVLRQASSDPEQVMRRAGLDVKLLHNRPGSAFRKYVRGNRSANGCTWTVDYSEFEPKPRLTADLSDFSRVIVFLNGSEIFNAAADIDFSQRRLKETCHWIKFCAENHVGAETAEQIIGTNLTQVESIIEGVVEAEDPKRFLKQHAPPPSIEKPMLFGEVPIGVWFRCGKFVFRRDTIEGHAHPTETATVMFAKVPSVIGQVWTFDHRSWVYPVKSEPNQYARGLPEAENPRKAIQAAKSAWKLVSHDKETLRREGWIIETWEFERADGWKFYLEKYIEDTARPERFYWRGGTRANNDPYWRTTGTLDGVATYDQAYTVVARWAEAVGTLKKPKLEAEDPKKFLKKQGHELYIKDLIAKMDLEGVPHEDSFKEGQRVRRTRLNPFGARPHGGNPNDIGDLGTITRFVGRKDEPQHSLYLVKWDRNGFGTEYCDHTNVEAVPVAEAEDPKGVFKKQTAVSWWAKKLAEAGYQQKGERYVFSNKYEQFRAESDVIELHVGKSMLIFDACVVSLANEMDFGTFTFTPTPGELTDAATALKKLYESWAGAPQTAPQTAAQQLKETLVGVFGKDRTEEAADGVYVSARWNEAEDPKRALKAAQSAVGNQVRTMLEKCKFKAEAKDIRYERWVRPGFEPDARWEAVRYMPGGAERWDLTKYMREGTTPLWSMNALGPEMMVFRLKRLFCHPLTGEPFECFNPYGQ